MKVTVELALSTGEFYKLFERQINGDQLFIEAILQRFSSFGAWGKMGSNIGL